MHLFEESLRPSGKHGESKIGADEEDGQDGFGTSRKRKEEKQFGEEQRSQFREEEGESKGGKGREIF